MKRQPGTPTKPPSSSIERIDELARALVRTAFAPTFLVHADRILVANAPMAQLFRTEEAALVDASPLSFVVPEDRERVGALIRQILAGEPSHDAVRFSGLRTDGTRFACELHGAAAIADRKNLFVGTLRPTEACELQHPGLGEAPLLKSRLTCVLGGIPEGVLIVDAQRRLFAANASFGRMFGIEDPQRLAGGDVTALREARRRTLPNLEHLFRLADGLYAGPSLETIEQRIETDEPVPRMIHVFSSPICDDDRQYLGRLWVFRDVSSETQLQKARNEFVSTAAHELRTPVTTIQGFSDILMTRDISPTEQKEFLRYIHLHAQRLNRLVGAMLDLSRVESGRGLELNRRWCPLRWQITEAIESLRAQGARQRFEVKVPEALLVYADAERMVSVWANLLDNARRFSADDSRIRITAAIDPCRDPQKTYVRVAVVDQGAGMTPEVLAHAFEPFYREDPGSSGRAGVGLGLSIVRAVVREHDGDVELASNPGAGTSATVWLPGSQEPLGTAG